MWRQNIHWGRQSGKSGLYIIPITINNNNLVFYFPKAPVLSPIRKIHLCFNYKNIDKIWRKRTL